MSPARFEPAIPKSERSKNHALDRVATGIGFQSMYVLVNFLYVFAGKFIWAIKGLSGCWRLGPFGLRHRVVLVVNRRFKETYSLHFRVPLPLTLKMEAVIYSEKGGIRLQDMLSKPKTLQFQHSASWTFELLCRSRWRVIWSRFEFGIFRMRVGSTSMHIFKMSSDYASPFVVVSVLIPVTSVAWLELSLEIGTLAVFLVQAFNKLSINLTRVPTSIVQN